MHVFAGVAQLVEQRIRNAKVGSSTLLTGTNRLSGLVTQVCQPVLLEPRQAVAEGLDGMPVGRRGAVI